MHTRPQGIFELKYFVNSSISRVQGDRGGEREREGADPPGLIVNEDPRPARSPISGIAEMLRVGQHRHRAPHG